MSAAVIAVCSWISVPMPAPLIPFTMQTFAVFLTIGILGLKNGTAAVVLYVFLGAMGVPVFSGFRGGVSVLFGTTGGYILGFVFTALVTGAILKRFGRKISVMAAAMALGCAVCYAFGTAWYMFLYASRAEPVGIAAALSLCVFPYIVPDMIKIALAILVSKRLGKHIHLH